MDQARIMMLPSGFGPRVEVLKATYQSQTFTRHTHDTYTLGMVTRGAGTFWCRGAEHLASKGDIVAIPPGEVHTGSVRSGVDALSYLAVYLPAGVALMHSESAGLRGRLPEFASVLIRDAAVRRSFEALNEVIDTFDGSAEDTARADKNSTPNIDAAVEEAVYSAIGALIRRHADQPGPTVTIRSGRSPSRSRVVGIIREVIDDSYASSDETSLHVLAERAGVSPFRVIRAFREATGLSPHHYLIQVRVQRARELLATGARPSMTALMTGFTDQSHLTYHFKKHLGITPARYQRCVMGR